MIKALCFDLDGTLGGYAGDFRAFLALLRSELMLHRCDPNRFADIVLEELGRDGPLTLESALRRTLARLEERAPSELGAVSRAALRAYAEDVRPAPGAVPLLERLDAAGVPMALVSNGPEDMQRAALEALGIERRFRAVLVSGDPDVASRKPAARIFSLACTGLEALPSETAMVGDSLEGDVGGALAYGMQAVLVGRGVEPGAGDGETSGVPVVQDVHALDALLRERYGL